MLSLGSDLEIPVKRAGKDRLYHVPSSNCKASRGVLGLILDMALWKVPCLDASHRVSPACPSAGTHELNRPSYQLRV